MWVYRGERLQCDVAGGMAGVPTIRQFRLVQYGSIDDGVVDPEAVGRALFYGSECPPKQVHNVLRDKELREETVCAFFAHTAADRNKRIAAALFLWFLEKNRMLYKSDGTKRIGVNALVAMTLLIAESKPAEKEILTKVVTTLLTKREA